MHWLASDGPKDQCRSGVEKAQVSGERGASKGCMPRSEEGGWKRA